VVKVVSGELNDAVGMLRGTPVFGSVLGLIHWKNTGRHKKYIGGYHLVIYHNHGKSLINGGF